MKRSIVLRDTKVEYTVRRSARARRVRLSVNCAAGVVLTVPRFIGLNRAEQFIRQKAEWIIKTLRVVNSRPKPVSWADLGLTKIEAIDKARALAKEKLEYWNQFYKFSYNRVAIKTHKGRWGSCSRLKNLNFNYKIIFLPEHLVDYIVIHELCHLGELNHSSKFWRLVGQVIPDYQERRRQLKKIAV